MGIIVLKGVGGYVNILRYTDARRDRLVGTDTKNEVHSPVEFATHPERYKHWKLTIDGSLATLNMDVDEFGGLRPGYQLKLNSYDLGGGY